MKTEVISARIWYDTRYAQDGRQRRYGVSQSWRWRYFWGVYSRFRPCVRKIVATQKCSWHVCASCCLKRVFVRKLSQSNHTPLPAQIFGLGGGCRLVLAWIENCGQAWRGLCGATCRKIFVFQLTSRLRVSITTQLLTLTWWEFWYESLDMDILKSGSVKIRAFGVKTENDGLWDCEKDFLKKSVFLLDKSYNIYYLVLVRWKQR